MIERADGRLAPARPLRVLDDNQARYMVRLSVAEAKVRFCEVVRRAERGRGTVITRRGKAVARVVPEAKRPERWDRSAAVDRIVEFSKRCRVRRKVDLAKLIATGRP